MNCDDSQKKQYFNEFFTDPSWLSEIVMMDPKYYAVDYTEHTSVIEIA